MGLPIFSSEPGSSRASARRALAYAATYMVSVVIVLAMAGVGTAIQHLLSAPARPVTADVAHDPPADWNLERRREYFDWAKQVVDQLRGRHAELKRLFYAVYAKRP